jgi:hypothetical protein
MDYTYGEYDVRLVLNAADAIVRFEERATRKLYEATFFDRDFAEFKSIGGLEFVMKLLVGALCRDGPTLESALVDKNLLLTVTYAQKLLPKPIVVSFPLPAIRRATCGEDTETLTRRIKELESKLVGITELRERVVELEFMTDGIVLIPGLLPIPNTVQMFCVWPLGVAGQGDALWPAPFAIPKVPGAIIHGDGTNVAIANTPTYASITDITYSQFGSVYSVKQVKHLTNCNSLHIMNNKTAKPINDLQSIGALRKLTSLTLTYISNLTDISWIESLTELDSVIFYGCSSLVDITQLRKLTKLKTLDIRLTGVKNTECLTNSGLTILK